RTAQRLQSGPMHFWAEMMFRVVAVIKPRPVIELVVRAHAPCNRLVWVAAVVAIVAVQIREAVTEIPKRQKETDVMPVKDAENNKRDNEACQLEHSPKRLSRIFAFQFLENSLRVLTKETARRIFQRMLCFTVMAVLVN